jgi:hypothetical protein
MRASVHDSIGVVGTGPMEKMINEVEKGDWHPVNIGRTYVSDNTVYNLFGAVCARRKGLGTHLPIGGGACYLFDGSGRRYYMKEEHHQLRFKARLYSSDGNYKEIELIHDTGAAATILKSGDAQLWEEQGTGVVKMGGFTGNAENLTGGNELCLMLRAEVGPFREEEEEEMNRSVMMCEIAKEEEAEKKELLMVSTRSKQPKKEQEEKSGKVKEKERQEDKATKEELKKECEEEDKRREVEIELILKKMTDAERESVLRQVKSASSLKESIEERQNNLKVNGSDQLSKEIGVLKRIDKMKECFRKYPHLSSKKMNRMVKEGDLKGGIEVNEEAREKEEASYIAKGTKVGVHRKKKEEREDPGKGFRAPFFMVEMDLIDLTNETKGNKWGYNWLMVIICKEYGTLKIYPLRGKNDVRTRWRQFKQWMKVITPYCVARLGVEPKVMIAGSDRGTEFITTHGMQKGELDQELYDENIFRYTPTAGDSNKLGKVERANRNIITNVNSMLRLGGARNDMAYYAAAMFEYHYNTTPTDANGVGNGEAPYKTLGIPYDLSRHVRFFCPAFLKTTKGSDSETGKSVNQTKLVERSKKCFIVGYGGSFSQGADHDGYTVVVPPSKEGEEVKIYSSNDVVPAEHLEVSRSLLRGVTDDALGEGRLVRKMFDIEGVERIEQTNAFKKKKSTIAQEVESTAKQSKRMTAGTGVTGQMRYEMEDRGNKANKNDLMSDSEAKRRLSKARSRNMLLKFKRPGEAKKGGDSRKRYDVYWKTTTFQEYDALIKEDDARKNDLTNDLKKGHLKLEDNPEQNVEEFSYFSDEEEEGVVSTVGSVPEQEEEAAVKRVGLMVGLCNDASLTIGLCNEVEETSEIDKEKKGARVKELSEAIFLAAEKELEMEAVPLWMALAVYYRAAVWVDGRKQPYTIKEAMMLPEWKEWREAVIKEITGLLAMGVWQEVLRKDLKEGTKVLPGRMILEIKSKDGKFEKCKGRYVSRGDLSNRGEHYFESSSHQVRAKSMKIFYALAATQYGEERRECRLPRNLDISQAYLSRVRSEDEAEIYMELPEETFGLCHDKKSGYVAKMLRHLYGEVDGGRAFERELIEFLDKIGAKATVSDRMVFNWKWKGQSLLALAHVDDIMYNGDNDEILDEFFRRAEQHFGKLTGGTRAEYILGIKIVWDLEEATVTLSQRAFVEKFLDEFGYKHPVNGETYKEAMEKKTDKKQSRKSKTKKGGYDITKKKDTPMPGEMEIRKNDGRKVLASEWDTFKWVGYANWLVSMTRVDLAGVVNQIGRHTNNPGEQHLEIMKHAMRYLIGTMDLGLTFHGKKEAMTEPYDHRNKLIAYVDSMHGAGNDTMCVIVMLNGAAVIWKVLKQRVVTTSTAHSEMIALQAGARELQWATDFMTEVGYEQGTVRMLGDNQSANLQATGDYKSSKSDHYRRVQFYVEDNVNRGLMWIDKVGTADNVADIGTKQVTPVVQFEKLRNIIQGVTPKLVLSEKVKEIMEGLYDTRVRS